MFGKKLKADDKRQLSAFTLVELLVVVAIISMLAAIIFPVFSKVKLASMRVGCQTNLAQVSHAFESYTSDYDSCYPNVNDAYLWMGRHWRWPMNNYLCFDAKYDEANSNGANQITGKTNNVLACPADLADTSKYDKTSYGYSASFYHTPDQINTMTSAYLLPAGHSMPCATISTSMVLYPANKAIAADWSGAHSGDSSDGWWSWNGSRNYLFVDGHVKYLTAKKILPAISSDVSRTPYPDINLTTDGVSGKDIE